MARELLTPAEYEDRRRAMIANGISPITGQPMPPDVIDVITITPSPEMRAAVLAAAGISGRTGGPVRGMRRGGRRGVPAYVHRARGSPGRARPGPVPGLRTGH